jgi:hypothetical protein
MWLGILVPFGDRDLYCANDLSGEVGVKLG